MIDGDTLEISGWRIRLHGIDAPESRQLCHLDGKPWQCGKDAANALADKIARRPVTCEDLGRDRHIPGGKWYDRTKIDPAKGEQWFCPEAEARTAGWRKSNQ